MENGKGKTLKQPDLFNTEDFESTEPGFCKDDLEKYFINPYLSISEYEGKGVMQNDLFDVQKVEEDNKVIKAEEHRKQVEEAQQKMELPYFPEPKNDNEKLLNFQYEYIKNKDQKAWGELLKLAFVVAGRIVRKEVFENKLPYDSLDREEKTSIAVEYVLRRYSKDVGWYVSRNYISALKKGVFHAIYYQTKKDAETDSIETVMPNKI